MLNFMKNVFEQQASPRNTCLPHQETIQGCLGCDGECLFTCYSMCADECQAETRDNVGGGGNCNYECTGKCFSVASIIGGGGK